MMICSHFQEKKFLPSAQLVALYFKDWKSFTINGTGTVFAKQIFDFERQKLYELRIQLCDFLDACVELTVFVAVNDLNDHCPEFKNDVSLQKINKNENKNKNKNKIKSANSFIFLESSTR